MIKCRTFYRKWTDKHMYKYHKLAGKISRATNEKESFSDSLYLKQTKPRKYERNNIRIAFNTSSSISFTEKQHGGRKRRTIFHGRTCHRSSRSNYRRCGSGDKP